MRYVGLPEREMTMWDIIPADLPRTRWYRVALIDAGWDHRAVVAVDHTGKNLGRVNY